MTRADWELVHDEPAADGVADTTRRTTRMAVPGGWLVNVVHEYHGFVRSTERYGEVRQSALTFVPDPTHSWQVP